MSQSENEKPPGHPTRELISWIVGTLATLVTLVVGATALFHPAKEGHAVGRSATLNQVGPGAESGMVENVSAPNGVVAGVINGAVTVGGQ